MCCHGGNRLVNKNVDTGNRCGYTGIMTLADYLRTRTLNGAEFGRQIGASRSAVARWLKGARIPNTAQMRAIMAATGGAVTPNDFLGEPAPRKRRAPLRAA